MDDIQVEVTAVQTAEEKILSADIEITVPEDSEIRGGVNVAYGLQDGEQRDTLGRIVLRAGGTYHRKLKRPAGMGIATIGRASVGVFVGEKTVATIPNTQEEIDEINESGNVQIPISEAFQNELESIEGILDEYGARISEVESGVAANNRELQELQDELDTHVEDGGDFTDDKTTDGSSGPVSRLIKRLEQLGL